ncbi:MAG: hypothetical protein HY914_17910 [Desulfomonile tiedjei]|nr:hypothetical protein [Desulfomonile tiedjei]
MIRLGCLSCVVALLVFSPIGGLHAAENVQVLKSWSIDGMDGILTTSEVTIDKETSSDGKGALKIVASQPRVVPLFEVPAPGVDNATVIYQAKLRAQDVKGQAYLEMWCRFPEKGEFFSRGLDAPLSGSTEWVLRKTPFFLKKGEKPDLIKLNLVINGTGTVWIDDVQLLKGPLQ